MRKLQLALSKKDKMELQLSNLEKLKAEGAVDDLQYKTLKGEYSQVLNQALSQIESIKSKLNKEIEAIKVQIGISQQELSNLEVKFKVGEFDSKTYFRKREIPQKKLKKAQDRFEELTALVTAESAKDLGEMEVKPKKEKTLITGTSPTGGKSWILGVIGSVLLMTAVFLPLLKTSVITMSLYQLFSFASLAQDISGLMGEKDVSGYAQYLWICYMLPGILALVSLAVSNLKVRSILFVLFGLIGLGLVSWMGAELLGELEVTLKELLPYLDLGFYTYLLGAFLLIIGGAVGLRGIETERTKITGKALAFAGAGTLTAALLMGGVFLLKKAIPEPSRIDLQVNQGTTQFGIKALNVTVTNKSKKPIYLHKSYSMSMDDKTDYHLAAYSFNSVGQVWQELPFALWDFPDERAFDLSDVEKIGPNGKVVANLRLLFKCEKVKVAAKNYDGSDTIEKIVELTQTRKKSLFE